MNDDRPTVPEPSAPASPGQALTLLDDALRRQEACWRQGRPVSVEGLAATLPKSATRPEFLLELICKEVILREEAGELPTLHEYQARFPELAAALAIQWAVDEALLEISPQRPALPTAERAGEHIGRYEVQAELGRGGVSVVYRAWDPLLKRVVAVKRLRAGSDADAAQRQRFRTEAEAVARLHHPNVVQIYDVGEAGGQPFFAMEYCPDGNLQQQLRGAPLPGRAAAALIEPIARAVAAAHELHIIHRDLKPANIMVTVGSGPWAVGSKEPSNLVSSLPTGHWPLPTALKIADFGLAKQLDDANGWTQTGTVTGTPAYMAPEQAFGASQQVGAAADIYALGAVLYECLTGRPPFQGTTIADTLDQVRHREPVSVRQLQPQVHADLETIVHKCLQKEPAQRYATAADVADDLRRFLEGRPIQARPLGRAHRTWRWCRRNPMVASLTGAIAALLVAVAVGSTLAALSLNARKKEALDQLWRAKLNEARAEALSRQSGQRFTSLRHVAEAFTLAQQLGLAEDDRLQLRNAAIAALSLPDVELVKEGNDWPDGLRTISFDADLASYARSDDNGRVSIHRLSDDQKLCSVPGLGNPTSVRLSPDGRHVVVCEDSATRLGPLQVWRLDRPEPCCIHEGTSLTASFADFSSDGRVLVYGAHDRLIVVELATGRMHSWPLTEAHLTSPVKCSPQGDRVAIYRTVNGRDLVEIRDLTTGIVLTELHRRGIRPLAWHPDGRLLAIAHNDPRPGLSLWDSDLRHEVAVLEGHKQGNLVAFFNHAGDRLISTDWSGVIRLWDVARGHQVLSTLGLDLTGAAFSRDDQYLACLSSAGRRLRLLRFAAGQEVRSLARRVPVGTGQYVANAPSREGNVALCSREQDLLALSTFAEGFQGMAVVDWPSGRELAHLPVPGLNPLGFDETGALWTTGRSPCDFLRWRRSVDRAAGIVRFGPPEPIFSMPGLLARGVSANGRVLVLADYDHGAMILHLGERNRLVPTGPQQNVQYAVLSPDRRWVATGSISSDRGRAASVWDAQTGQLAQRFAVDPECSVGFSPDKRWLVTGGGGFRLWRVGSWEEGPWVRAERDGTSWVFSADSRLLALGGHGSVRLVRPDTGAEVAQLTSPETMKFDPMFFTPDGGELLVQNEDSTQGLFVWDLRMLRRELAALGLDWDDPPLSDRPLPSTGGLEAGAGRKVEFVGVDLAADGPKLRRHFKTQQLLALHANPFDPWAHFCLGYLIEDAQPAAAYDHYTAALVFQPEQLLAHERRAEAALRLGRWSQVVADASIVLQQQPERPIVLLRRALALQKLNRHAEAIADLSVAMPHVPHAPAYRARRMQSYEALGKKANAEADRRVLLREAPLELAQNLNEQAWQLVTGPPEGRDVVTALNLARQAVDLAPGVATYVNTLGVAQYRNGLYKEAVASLEQSLAKGNSQDDVSDQFFLALCHHQLGEPARARACYEQGLRLLQKSTNLTPGQLEELKAFQAEAEAGLTTSTGRRGGER